MESLSSSGRTVLCVILSKDMVGEHLEWQLETANIETILWLSFTAVISERHRGLIRSY